MSNSVLPITIDDLFKISYIGSIQQAIGDSFYGINHRQIPTALLANRERYGYTFFTRPQLNMSTLNIQAQRLFFPLLTNDKNTIQNYVRTILDPRVGILMNPTLCDPYNAFIPVLTNNLKAISGWDDYIAPTFTSAEGNYKESVSFVDGNILNFQTYDIDCTFRNTRGDPIIYMIYIWLLYQSFVFEGIMSPYPDMIIENEIDYNTRIYRLVMDKSNTFVRKILATGASFPITLPLGNFFDFTSDSPTNSEIYDFTIRFRCMGITYQDDILIKEFNQTVEIFNPDMRSNFRSSSMVKVPKSLLVIFNNRGYPRINPATYELEWYVSSAIYSERLNLTTSYGALDNSSQVMMQAVEQLAASVGPSPSLTPLDLSQAAGYSENLKLLNTAVAAQKLVTPQTASGATNV